MWIGWLLSVSCSPAVAQDYAAVTSTNAVVRQAPGQQFAQVGVIPAGTPVAVDICFDEGAYCAVIWDNSTGFVAGNLMTLEGSAETVMDKEAERWRQIRSAPRVAAIAAPHRIAAWGDSLTAGTGASGRGTAYPAVAQTLFSPFRQIGVHGFGGKTSSEIKALFLAETFDREATTWIWVGRNNYEQADVVVGDVDEMIATLGHDRYLVGSVLNGGYENEAKGGGGYTRIVALNAALEVRYGDRFVDVRAALMAAADPVRDAVDIAADRVPQAFRIDDIHLNDVGYRVVAEAWEQATVRLGF